MALKKADYEKELLGHIQKVGLEKYYETNGEGRKRNTFYYQFNLKDGTIRYWTNPSQAFKDTLGIK